MTFSAQETSQQGGRPAYLYELTLGADVKRYTNVEGTIDSAGNLWENESISHTEPEVSADARTQTINVNLPADNAFVSNFTTRVPTESATIKIRRVHRGDLTDPKLFFRGVVRNVRLVNNTQDAQLICLTTEGRFTKKGPTRNYGPSCGWMLFDSDCKAVRSSFLYTGLASSVSGDTLVVSGVDTGLGGAGRATGGELVVVSTQERRTIRLHAATDTITLLYALDVDPTGETVEVAMGCDRTIGTCHDVFSNGVNHGGVPYRPGRDVFRYGVR